MKEYNLVGQLQYWRNQLYDTTKSIDDLTTHQNMIRDNIDSIESRIHNVTNDILNKEK
jgi:hypothetical protein|tara:strand:- start:185 stop:358 length:174 start_codon:yes stop_codon:yes gene_type:complete